MWRVFVMELESALHEWAADHSARDRFIPTLANNFIVYAWDESWLRKTEQWDKWSFCLKAASYVPHRRDNDETATPEPHTGLKAKVALAAIRGEKTLAEWFKRGVLVHRRAPQRGAPHPALQSLSLSLKESK
jgi:hypothetical protein